MSGHAIETLEHAPAGGQGVVECHGLLEGLHRLGCLAQGDKAVAALLVQATEARMVALEDGKCLQRLGDLAQIPLRNGHEQQRVPLLGLSGQQRIRVGQDLGELLLPEQRTERGDLGRRHGRGVVDIHLRHASP